MVKKDSAYQRLQRILELEEKQGWRNRAVIGGAEALRERWVKDALAEGEDEATVQAIQALLTEYAQADQSTRPALAQRIGRLMAEGLPPEEQAPAAPPNEPVQPPEPTPEPEAGLEVIDQVGASRDRSRQDVPRPPKPTPKPEPERDLAPPTSVLGSPVTILRGIGGQKAEKLARLGIRTIVDLIWHIPFRYDDFSKLRTIAELEPGERVTVVANLWQVKERKISLKRHMVQGILNDGTGTLRATWWSKWIAPKLQAEVGKTLHLRGTVGLYMGQKTLEHPEFERADNNEVAQGQIVPVYRLTEGISNRQLRAWINQAMKLALPQIKDPLPRSIRERYELLDLRSALEQIHGPKNQDRLAAARKRLAFDELFYIQLGVQRRRHLFRQATAPALASSSELVERFWSALPFEPTGAQRRVLQEIAQDIQRTVPMSRLVQGDVGSGKTVVAAGAMFIAAANGAQSALLAPTQILAEQHHRGLSKLLAGMARSDGHPLEVALLTGRVTGSERERVLAGLADGSIDVVVGTTALIQEAVTFRNLGLAVVDEQHRFGVEQRGTLRDKGANGGTGGNGSQELPRVPHMLVMSATPIPRSLALTLYGDLDVSVIDEMPPGRQPVKTKWFLPTERERLYAFLRRRVEEGRQGYIIYPLVEESEKLAAGAAVDSYERLSQEIFPDLRLTLLHGRMSGSEKDEVMRAFAAGEYDILVSTTVVEVGIDVPNATVMLIEDAERFGLAQLHQLRGRVGRGEHQSYCALISKGDSPHARERLEALVATNDGFALAEKDLELRGPGDFLGTRQSGLPDLRVAALGDTATLAMAQEAARTLFQEDPELRQYPRLLEEVERFWRGHGDVS